MLWVLGIAVLASIFLALYFLPAYIAFKRKHHYKFVILAFNISGVFWVVALVWALYPSEKSLIDPIIGNVTGLGKRNTGDTVGSVVYGSKRGYENEQDANNLKGLQNIEKIEKLHILKQQGAITNEEYENIKKTLISN